MVGWCTCLAATSTIRAEDHPQNQYRVKNRKINEIQFRSDFSPREHSCLVTVIVAASANIVTLLLYPDILLFKPNPSLHDGCI